MQKCTENNYLTANCYDSSAGGGATKHTNLLPAVANSKSVERSITSEVNTTQVYLEYPLRATISTAGTSWARGWFKLTVTTGQLQQSRPALKIKLEVAERFGTGIKYTHNATTMYRMDISCIRRFWLYSVHYMKNKTNSPACLCTYKHNWYVSKMRSCF